MNPFNLSGKHYFWNCKIKKPIDSWEFPDFFINYDMDE